MRKDRHNSQGEKHKEASLKNKDIENNRKKETWLEYARRCQCSTTKYRSAKRYA